MKYFVSYWQGEDANWKMGRCEVEREQPIVGIGDIVGLEADLKREFKADIVVLGWHRFERQMDYETRFPTRLDSEP